MKRLAATAAAAAVTMLGAPTIAPAQQGAPTAPPCTGQGAKLSYICGLRTPEDLVQVPGTNWIIASGFAASNAPGGLALIDGDAKTGARVPFATAAKPTAGCPGPLDAAKFSAHGLNIRAAGRGKARLYVVGHGAREAIELFDVVSGKDRPTITWVGCIPAPAGARFNSVVPLKDGRVIATDFTHEGFTTADAAMGKITGAVYLWRPGGTFEKLPGTDLPGPNGVEVSPDEKQLFVAVTGTSSTLRYELANTAKAPIAVKTEARTDNLRWGPDGKLLLAGPGPDLTCKAEPGKVCGQAPGVLALDPKTMTVTNIYRGPAEPGFPGTSSALIVGKTLWFGSYQADRVAYTPL